MLLALLEPEVWELQYSRVGSKVEILKFRDLLQVP
jgi:hypothetical protein